MRRRTYNPGQLTAEELKGSFIARQENLAEMLRIVRDQEPGRPCQHMLLVGARGMGKTTLGLRFLQAVREAPDLAAVWQPVPFDEESYGVTGSADFWLAALRHLSRATGEDRWQLRAEDLTRGESDASRREAYALASVLDFCKARGRRVILFVENLDLIFEQIADEREMHALRGVLIGHPELLLVGSANAVFDGIRRQQAPFYEFFQVITLRGLDAESCRAVFEGTFAREDGRLAQQSVSAEQGRIETIRALTGGNPRLLVLASEILMQSPLGTAFEDLETLIDEQTPYFKALIEALPAQARKVFNHLAGEWTPLRARDVSAGVSLTASHTSAQLRQLIDKGYVREVGLPDEARARYEVADRFYNIYYLLRFSRPGRERLSRFVAFLHDLYGDGGMYTLYGAVLRALRERTMSATELTDWVDVFSEHVAEDREFAGREEWFDAALRISIEQVGPDGSILDQLEKRVPDAAGRAYLDRARVLLTEYRLDEAEAILQRAARQSSLPRFAMLHLLGLVQAMRERTTEALASLEEAARTAPTGDDTGRIFASAAWMSVARMRLSRGELDAVSAAAETAVELTRNADPDEHRRINAKSLGLLGGGLWKEGEQASAMHVWSLASRVVRPGDAAELRVEAAKVLCKKGEALLELGRHEESCRVLEEVGQFVGSADGPVLRKLRLFGLAFEGRCHWELEQPARALAVWQQAMDFVQPGDQPEVGALAASCLGLVSLGQLELAEHDPELLAASRESARMTVELAPDSTMPLQLLAQVLAYSGEWQESIAVVRRAVETLGEADEATRMLGTLIQVAAAGHVAEVRDLMADTRLTKDLEPLWHAVRLELGESVEPLPAEIKESVMGIRERLNPQ